jgi:hypothetical protein
VGQPVEIRVPIAVRVYGVCFGLLWVGFLIVGITRSEPSQIPFAGFMAIFGVAFIYRIDGIKVVADESGLLVRNIFSTSRFRWGEVEDFRLGRSMMGMPFGQVIHVLLRNGEVVTADVTMRPWIMFGGRAKLERTLQELRRWRPRQA